MSCGGPSFFLQRSKNEPLLVKNGLDTTQGLFSTQNELRQKSCREKLPDPQTVNEWLQKGSINRHKLQDVKEGQLRKLVTSSTGVQPLTQKSFHVLEALEPKPSNSKESWPVNHSKLPRCQKRKFEDSKEGNFIKEALQGLIIGLSSAFVFCSILFQFVLKNKV